MPVLINDRRTGYVDSLRVDDAVYIARHQRKGHCVGGKPKSRQHFRIVIDLNTKPRIVEPQQHRRQIGLRTQFNAEGAIAQHGGNDFDPHRFTEWRAAVWVDAKGKSDSTLNRYARCIKQPTAFAKCDR
ncbi:hypothetical protein [Algiphilus sp.]|uniref:hypothetical protein n=1 Tax=Algiphilus sp. TaxID=1872431 RepID=UPI0032F07A11